MAIYNTLHLPWGLWKPVTSEVTYISTHIIGRNNYTSMAFRPGCPQANTSCTWTLIDVFVEFCLAWKSLVCLELEACGETPEAGSNYQIGITWFHFIQGHFLLKTMLRIQWVVIWNSSMTSNFWVKGQESKIPFQLMSYCRFIYFALLRLSGGFFRGFTSRSFCFPGGSVNFPEHSLSKQRFFS